MEVRDRGILPKLPFRITGSVLWRKTFIKVLNELTNKVEKLCILAELFIIKNKFI